MAEGETVDALRDKLPPRVRELVWLNQHLLSCPVKEEAPLNLHISSADPTAVSS